MYIKEASIKNFRSIQYQVFEAKSLNVLVGNNDIGKSNFLKALNLFFNNETEVGTPFNFRNDFSAFAITSQKKAPEIVIEITFSPPRSFDTRNVIWRKAWRREGLVSSEKRYSDNKPLEGRKKIGFWLDQINYSYVPAIKGQDYFAKLLSDLHNVLSETIEQELKSASENFIAKIRKHTRNISTELFNRLGMESSLQIPPDLSVLFEVLDFETGRKDGNISLKYRGDGIKVRHIPVILKFIGEQRNINRLKGAIKSSTIWGYEEPENNLELTKAFELAKDFLEYSEVIQVFVTTHSPAFYSLSTYSTENIETYIIKPDTKTNASIIERFDSQNITTLDHEMGLLPFITPHIQKLIAEKEELLKNINAVEDEIKWLNNPVLFVEGEIDRKIIERAIELHDPMLKTYFTIKACRGADGVADATLSWFYSRKEVRCVSLLDSDDAGKKARLKIDESVTSNDRNFKVMHLSKVPHLKSLFQRGIKVPFAIEDLFPSSVLKVAKDKGWLEFKESLIKDNDYGDPSRSFMEYCENVLQVSPDDCIYFYKIALFEKEKFCRYVLKLTGAERAVAFLPFKYLLADLKNKFEIDSINTESLDLRPN